MADSYHGKILHVDLTQQRWRAEELPRSSIGSISAAARWRATTCCAISMPAWTRWPR